MAKRPYYGSTQPLLHYRTEKEIIEEIIEALNDDIYVTIADDENAHFVCVEIYYADIDENCSAICGGMLIRENNLELIEKIKQSSQH